MFHLAWCSTLQQGEPPTNWSNPAMEEDTGPAETWWGHQLKKQPGTIWLIIQNMDGILTHTDGDPKLDCCYQLTTEYQADIIILTELNMAWDKLPYKAWLPQKTCGWWEASHWSVSHNKKDKHGDGFQPGGTAILILNEWAHRATRLGDNISRLGRWS